MMGRRLGELSDTVRPMRAWCRLWVLTWVCPLGSVSLSCISDWLLLYVISTPLFLNIYNSLPLQFTSFAFHDSTVDSGCTFWRKKKKSMTWNFGLLQKEKLEGKRMGIYCSEWSVTVKFSDIHWSAEHWKCNTGASTKAMSFSFDLDQIKMNWKSPTKWFFFCIQL